MENINHTLSNHESDKTKWIQKSCLNNLIDILANKVNTGLKYIEKKMEPFSNWLREWFEFKRTNAEYETYKQWHIFDDYLKKIEHWYWVLSKTKIHWENCIWVFTNDDGNVCDTTIIPVYYEKWSPVHQEQKITTIHWNPAIDLKRHWKNKLWVIKWKDTEIENDTMSIFNWKTRHNLPENIEKVYDICSDIDSEGKENFYYAGRDASRNLYINDLNNNSIQINSDLLNCGDIQPHQIKNILSDNWTIYCTVELETKDKKTILYKIGDWENWKKIEILWIVEKNGNIKLIKIENWELIRTKYQNWTTFIKKWDSHEAILKWQIVSTTEIWDHYNKVLSISPKKTKDSEQYIGNRKYVDESWEQKIRWNKYHARTAQDIENLFEIIIKNWTEAQRVIV